MLTTLVALAAIGGADTGRYTRSGLWFQEMGSGPAVVLIHGADLDSRSFGPVAERLAPAHRVILLDLRFHGRSRDSGGPFSFEGDVLEVLDAAGVDRATLVGHSLGSAVALDVALARPDRVERLVLIGPSIGGRPASKMPAGMEAMIAALKAGDLDRAGIVLSQMPVMTLYRRTDRQAGVAAMVRSNTKLLAADRTRVKPLG
ncbi:MAG: alpha/beta fold hydrolase, partial [Gemmatimonadota bacterium]